MDVLPKDIQNIIIEYTTQLNYRRLIKEYNKKIRPNIRIYINHRLVGISIDRFYPVRFIKDNKIHTKWGYVGLKSLFIVDLTDVFTCSDWEKAIKCYEKV